MRDSNYKSIANNRAAVTITTSLYDRRALDVTSDKPLVNSLNHLTYLVSSLAKVRETLSADGGIERLIEILHECHNLVFNVADTVFNSEKKLLTAWKWTLAFQCLVLIGTRGTEEIRQKVVKAGILPILATVLDNYLTLHERTFAHANSRPAPPLDARSDTSRNGDDGPPPTASGSISIANLDDTFLNTQNERDILRSLGTSYLSAQPMSAADAAAAAVAATSISGHDESAPFLAQSNSLTSDDYDNLSTEQLLQLVRVNHKAADSKVATTVNNDIRRRYLIANIVKKLREDKESDLLDDQFVNADDYDMDNGLQFLSNIYLQDERSCGQNPSTARTAPRNFTDTGVIIPCDDDIVWSLQLLAYISKYPYLKDVLQKTHLVIDMSIRDKQLKMYLEKQMRLKVKNHMAILSRPTIRPKSRKAKLSSGLERFQLSASNSPQMLNDLDTIDDILDEDKFELVGKADTSDCIAEKAEVDDDDDEDDEEEEAENHLLTDDDDRYLSELTQGGDENSGSSSYLTKLYDSIVDAESIVNDLEREVTLFHISDKINRCIEVECKRLSSAIANKRQEQKKFLTQKWDYDTYDGFDIDETSLHYCDYDESLIEYKTVNLFPIVEKFTFLSGTDMYYWSGVIMRNSCRRNDYRGGVRQCGNLECGKWESYPREFLKCRRCKRTKYCSRECQMRAWHCHRNWCIPSTSSSSSTTVTTATGAPAEDVVPRPANLDSLQSMPSETSQDEA